MSNHPMALDTPPFTYLPLPPRHTRLLMILPGHERPGGIQCRMRTMSLDDPQALSYTAMSYTWGDSTARREIEIDGHPFETTAAVYEMLLHREHSRWLWIDALCINQVDLDERALQVRLMGKVYSMSDKVEIWLGPASDDSDLAIDFMELLKIELPSLPSDDSYIGTGPTHHLAPEWAMFGKLCNRSWFSRLWVMQEAVLASSRPQFSCGSRVFSWEDFRFVMFQVSRIRGLPMLSPDPAPQVADVEMCSRRIPAGHRMLTILENLKRISWYRGLSLQEVLQYTMAALKATDPRDKIYGLYGISMDVNDCELTPDYTKSVEDVYIQTTRHMISKNKSLDLLVDAGVQYRSDIQLPSWVPDYAYPDRCQRIAFFYAGENIYKASGSSKPTIDWTAESNGLTVSGAIIDDIEYLGTSSTNNTGDELREWAFEAFSLVQHFNEIRPNAISDDALWRTLIGDRARDVSPVLGTYSIVFEAFRHWVYHPEDFLAAARQDPHTDIGKSYKKVRGFATCMAEITTNRKFGLSRGGHSGILPALAAVGDKVAVVLGLSTPFIVRECAGTEDGIGEQKYILVGECYMHDLMNGEGLKGTEVKKIIFQ